ncbi:hypothetical protein BO70DRAFT_361562 [Aspergillus heteromorphus CBS 117.55]|uniref:DUF1687-domain-containing protein n=1 Tax=Aspergillus heteromorphus CBS 117.55 TaxID=1448321 RepID=A0A317WCE8_9EURO|nr:uncharacterized protein BO70DRAFT_361562 [Aspergillus heteromorphus CBS 117.55]PWY83441.1 hypothetical protein BO70DRAFT_361562 [Aspergillus heteromorphus CBS 117.55]
MVFRFAKTLDPITLFHTPSLPSSKTAHRTLTHALTLSQSANAPASSRGEFQLEVTTAPPTTDQLRNILDYVTGNPAGAGTLDRGARYSVAEVVRGPRMWRMRRTVDWTSGQAVVGDNESEILKMVQQINQN